MAYDVDPNKTYGGDVKHLLNYVPGIQWVTIADAHFGKEEAQIIGLPKDCFPSFVVDGVLQRDKEAVYSLPTSLIERIEILKDANAAIYGGFNVMGGVIAIFTRKGKSENIPNKNRVCKWIGYSQTKEFYAPDSMPDEGYFANTKDQNTIYWNPNLDTDSDGNATVTFYTNNLKHEDYLIHCEGRTINGKIGVFTSPYYIKIA